MSLNPYEKEFCVNTVITSENGKLCEKAMITLIIPLALVSILRFYLQTVAFTMEWKWLHFWSFEECVATINQSEISERGQFFALPSQRLITYPDKESLSIVSKTSLSISGASLWSLRDRVPTQLYITNSAGATESYPRHIARFFGINDNSYMKHTLAYLAVEESDP